MKYLTTILLVLSLSGALYSQELQKNTVNNESDEFRIIQLTWIDLYFQNFFSVPNTRLADFSDMNFGAGTRFNFMIFNIKPLWLFTGIMFAGHVTNSHRLDTIVDLGVTVGAGWRFTILERFFITPKFSYGIMFHFTYGDYYNAPDIYPNDSRAGKKDFHFFTDQYFHYEVEFAYDISPKSRKLEMEVFFSPSFIHFAEKHRQGLEWGYLLGVRMKFEISGEEEPVAPAILAGRVIDAETKQILKDTVPEISDDDAERAVLSKNENFAFSVEPGEDYTLRAERAGYEPVSLNVDESKLKSGERTIVVLPMKLSTVWGLYGYVYRKDTKDPIEEVNAVVVDNFGKTKEMETDDDGRYKMKLFSETDYNILLKKEGYFTVRCTFTTKGKRPGWYEIENSLWNAAFQKSKKGATIEFGNIYYDSGSWNLRRDSIPGLEKMAQFLTENPAIVVELGAHTDSMGNAKANLTLSQKRAESAVGYLLKKGIASARITPKGYGETRIKNRCVDGVQCSGKEHQENRRTELKVLEI